MILIRGDCLEYINDMIARKEKVDAIITDIPYGITQNKNDVFPDTDFFKKIWLVSKLFITTIQSKSLIKVVNSIPKEIKWYDIIWDKEMTSGFLNAKRQPLRKHEIIVVMYKKQPTYNPIMWESGKPIHNSNGLKPHNQNNNYGKIKPNEKSRSGKTDRYPTSILKIKKPHPSITKHPTQKPVKLYEWLVKTYTNKGDLVLDPFMGSGTTGVACEILDRDFIGIEQDDKYFETALKRLNQKINVIIYLSSRKEGKYTKKD